MLKEELYALKYTLIFNCEKYFIYFNNFWAIINRQLLGIKRYFLFDKLFYIFAKFKDDNSNFIKIPLKCKIIL